MNFPQGNFLVPAHVTRFVPGGDLEHYLQRRNTRLSNKECLDFSTKAVRMVVQLQPKFIHQDITPQNILLSRDPDENCGFVLILGDMGVARRLGMSGSIATHCESIAWRHQPPEVLLDRTATLKSDIFILGITIWQICHSKKKLYPAINTKAQLRKEFRRERTVRNAYAPLTFREDIHRGLQKIICEMTLLDPNERPTSGEILRKLKSMKGEFEMKQDFEEFDQPHGQRTSSGDDKEGVYYDEQNCEVIDPSYASEEGVNCDEQIVEVSDPPNANEEVVYCRIEQNCEVIDPSYANESE
eukprot:TRINITY_DN1279_c0_g1_i1.p1 TRINITY_DN1279_c0_g1~~TRINITY_DN1279_c0_g1_i1.p1  ORF type:complete len:299 (-),score=65.71 TRINITY_DN1279_c0_g1_i1:142-1038(-)